MNGKLRLWSLGVAALAVTTLLNACSGGGDNAAAGGGGGISGTGARTITTGKITGFGSVIVNGIEFLPSTKAGLPENRISFRFDNISTSREEGLRVGMVVTVQGAFDKATGKGEYESIVYQPELRGPLESGSVDPAAATFRILGRTVQVETATILDSITDLNELLTLQGQRPELEVSGNLDEKDTLHATRVALVPTAASSGAVQLKGTITALSAAGFSIGTITVATGDALFEGLKANELAPGLPVEVKGVLSGTTISGARIERLSPAGAAVTDDKVRIKGVARSAAGGGTFSLAGPNGPISVRIGGQTAFFRSDRLTDSSVVTVGASVEIEGTLQADGAVAATVVAVESEKTVKLEGSLRAVDTAAGTVTLNGVTVRTLPFTRFKDNRKTAPSVPLALADLADGDHLQIAGYLDNTGSVIASQLQRYDPSQVVILQGPVTTVAGNDMTILGVTVRSLPGGTRFSKGTMLFADIADFSALVTPKVTVVKAKGIFVPPALIDPATELEIQP